MWAKMFGIKTKVQFQSTYYLFAFPLPPHWIRTYAKQDLRDITYLGQTRFARYSIYIVHRRRGRGKNLG